MMMMMMMMMIMIVIMLVVIVIIVTQSSLTIFIYEFLLQAYHFFLLAQKQLYEGYLEASMKTVWVIGTQCFVSNHTRRKKAKLELELKALPGFFFFFFFFITTTTTATDLFVPCMNKFLQNIMVLFSL